MPVSALGQGMTISDQLARHARKIPDEIAFCFDGACPGQLSDVDELPRTVSGKVRKNELREHARPLTPVAAGGGDA